MQSTLPCYGFEGMGWLWSVSADAPRVSRLQKPPIMVAFRLRCAPAERSPPARSPKTYAASVRLHQIAECLVNSAKARPPCSARCARSAPCLRFASVAPLPTVAPRVLPSGLLLRGLRWKFFAPISAPLRVVGKRPSPPHIAIIVVHYRWRQ